MQTFKKDKKFWMRRLSLPISYSRHFLLPQQYLKEHLYLKNIKKHTQCLMQNQVSHPPSTDMEANFDWNTTSSVEKAGEKKGTEI